MPSLPSRLEIVARRRPVDLVVPGSTLPGAIGEAAAPYVAVSGPGSVELASGSDRLLGRWDGESAWLEVTAGGRTTRHRSRRMARADTEVREIGLTLTGTHLTVITRGAGPWTARGRVDLRDRLDTRDGAWLASLASDAPTGGRFGQLGLRDIRLVTNADGTAYSDRGRVLLTATSAGPGFFDTAHASVWELDPATLELAHRSDLFFRRHDRPGVYGDHAVHLLRDTGEDGTDEWLVATSTWGDFDPKKRPTVGVALARTRADLLRGAHLLDSTPLPMPVDGLRSVGTWDPHLVRHDGGWLVGFVSATRFFRFHPALAGGPALDDLSLLGAATDLTQCEGTTLVRPDPAGGWQVLASDKRRQRYPSYDLAMRETGALDAAYPTNIPWPTLVPVGEEWLMVAFNGRAYGGPLPGYGTHGEVVFLRSSR